MKTSDEELEILRGCCYKPCKSCDCCKPPTCCTTCSPSMENNCCMNGRFYAQYVVRDSNPTSSDYLSFLNAFNIGNCITLNGEETILLPKGWLYQISYVFLASPGANGSFEIIPHMNNMPGTNYAFFAAAGANSVNTSAAAAFLTNLALNQDLQLRFLINYDRTVNLDISGAVSIVPFKI